MNIFTLFLLLTFLFITNTTLHAGNYFNSSSDEQDVAIGGSILRSILENQQEEEETPPAELNIIENISKSENLSTLVKALQAADLTNVLKGNGPFTLFAPTNAAFDQLPPGTLPNLLKPENKSKLALILTYHIVPGRKTPGMLKTGKLKTLNGKELDVKTEGKSITINGTQIQPPEIVGLNGTIYIVDSVMLPN
jgi:uncharacterized surface protein with fasciclin (FAS1) repeats